MQVKEPITHTRCFLYSAGLTGSSSSEHEAATMRGKLLQEHSFLLPSSPDGLQKSSNKEEAAVHEVQKKTLSRSSVKAATLEHRVSEGVEATISDHTSPQSHEEEHLLINNESRTHSRGGPRHERVASSVPSVAVPPATGKLQS